jgi:hypothetical protein
MKNSEIISADFENKDNRIKEETFFNVYSARYSCMAFSEGSDSRNDTFSLISTIFYSFSTDLYLISPPLCLTDEICHYEQTQPMTIIIIQMTLIIMPRLN